jgi:hypothetical protein
LLLILLNAWGTFLLRTPLALKLPSLFESCPNYRSQNIYRRPIWDWTLVSWIERCPGREVPLYIKCCYITWPNTMLITTGKPDRI